MIKRRYFREDHGNKSSSSSSSDSDSDIGQSEEAVTDEEVDEECEDEHEDELRKKFEEESSGYQSEDSSRNDVDGPSIAILDNGDENRIPMYGEEHEINMPVKKDSSVSADSAKGTDKKVDGIEVDFANCILKCKSVYKCKLCPRIMCLNVDMVRMHLKSKRHARSKKLLEEGRLKVMLNSDDELEEEQETHAERHARTVSIAQQVQKEKKDSGRQRQNRRRKKRSHNHLEKKQQTQNSDKKRQRTEE